MKLDVVLQTFIFLVWSIILWFYYIIHDSLLYGKLWTDITLEKFNIVSFLMLHLPRKIILSLIIIWKQLQNLLYTVEASSVLCAKLRWLRVVMKFVSIFLASTWQDH